MGVANLAVVLAGGIGSRSGLDIPKQLFTWDGRTVLGRAIDVFVRHPRIDRVVVTAPGDLVETIAEQEPDVCVVAGGATRQDSVVAALQHVADDDLVLIHDAVRPFLPAEVVDRCLEALIDHDAVGTVVAAVDTIYRVAPDGGELLDVPARDALRQAQTPQAFRGAVIKDAHRRATAAGSAVTDDCSAVLQHRPDVSIALVEGDVRNIKLTTPEDFARLGLG